MHIRLGLCAVVLAHDFPAWAQSPVSLYYFGERPPYVVSEPDGAISGLVATPTNVAFKAAGISTQWVKIPPARVISEFKENNIKACSPGYFKNADRETWAKFTKPIYRDSPQALLVHKNFELPTRKLNDLLMRQDIALLVKAGFSYGTEIDKLIEKYQPNSAKVSVEVAQMLKMIAAKRADYMFISDEESASLIAQSRERDVKVIHLDDSPPGELRYIMCTRQVPDELIRKINEFIAFK